MLRELGSLNDMRREARRVPIHVGIGLNTGLMMLGIVGGERRIESTVIGDAVNLAARMETMTKSYGTPLLISEHTYYGAKGISRRDTRFIDRVKVKGKVQPQSVYEVFDADPPVLREAKRKTKTLFEEALAQYHLKEVPAALDLLSECLREAPDDTVAHVYRARCEQFLKTGLHESSGEFDLTIRWDPSLTVGQAEIDAQHSGLFDFVRELVETMRNSRDQMQTHKAIDFVDGYIANHFRTEEKCMAKNNYPFLQLQIDEHRRFSRYFKGFKDDAKKDLDTRRTFLLFHAQVFLIDWLVNHTSKLDRHFGRFLGRAAPGV
jgi:hemerythrin